MKKISKVNITDNLFTSKWDTILKEPEVNQTKIFKMRDIQADAYRLLRDKDLAILDAPTASGKAKAICWIEGERLEKDKHRKCVIAAPKKDTLKGFRGYFKLKYVDKNGNHVIANHISPDVCWEPVNYLCDNGKASNLSQFRSFLTREGDKNNINDRILICSHASLIDAFQAFPELFKNVDIVIDEAHHISYTLIEAEEDEDRTSTQYCNEMGVLVSYCIKNYRNKKLRLLLSTATFHRGDRIEIIPKEHISKFTKFYCPIDKYLKSCYWLKSFSFDFVMYGDYWYGEVKRLFKTIGKTIIYIPSVNSKYSYGDKQKDLMEIYRGIAGCRNPIIIEQENGLTLIKKGNGWIKVINLIDDSSIREKRLDLIEASHDSEDKSGIDVIVALNVFCEGSNWKWADRIIFIGEKGSLTDLEQRIGRGLRDAKDKCHLNVSQLLPFSIDQLNQEEVRENLNEFSLVLFHSMLFEDTICPIPLKIKVERKKEDGTTEIVEAEDKTNYLEEQMGGNEIIDFFMEVRDRLVKCDNKIVDFNINSKETRDKFAEIVSEVLTEHGAKNYHLEIAEWLRQKWIRQSIRKIKGIDISHIDYDIIQINPLAFLLTYSSKVCGLDTISEIREVFEKYGLSDTYNLEAMHPNVAKTWIQAIP